MDELFVRKSHSDLGSLKPEPLDLMLQTLDPVLILPRPLAIRHIPSFLTLTDLGIFLSAIKNKAVLTLNFLMSIL
jgi:hypothetical protein